MHRKTERSSASGINEIRWWGEREKNALGPGPRTRETKGAHDPRLIIYAEETRFSRVPRNKIMDRLRHSGRHGGSKQRQTVPNVPSDRDALLCSLRARGRPPTRAYTRLAPRSASAGSTESTSKWLRITWACRYRGNIISLFHSFAKRAIISCSFFFVFYLPPLPSRVMRVQLFLELSILGFPYFHEKSSWVGAKGSTCGKNMHGD